MKALPYRLRAGFTLIELTLAVFIGMAVASTCLVLVNQQFSFLRIYAAQAFLTEEAPIISTYMTKLIGQAERYRLHNSLADGLAGANPTLTNATTLVLNFQEPDGTARSGILCFQKLATDAAPVLYYYVVPATGTPATPSWILSKKPTDVRFSIESGILRMRLTGPSNELITYSGTMQQ